MKNIIKIAMSLFVVALVIPLAVGLLSMAGDTIVNGTATTLTDVADPTIITLLEVLLPVIAIIGIVLGFVSTKKS